MLLKVPYFDKSNLIIKKNWVELTCNHFNWFNLMWIERPSVNLWQGYFGYI
jgi:hypothetical protein